MQCLHVNFDPETRTVASATDAVPERWEDVCERFGNDVRRVMPYTEESGYSAVYACFDEDNQPVYFLVEEGEQLKKLRHRNFLSKLGRPPS